MRYFAGFTPTGRVKLVDDFSESVRLSMSDAKDTAEAFRSVADSDTKLVLITNIPDGFTQKDYIS